MPTRTMPDPTPLPAWHPMPDPARRSAVALAATMADRQ